MDAEAKTVVDPVVVPQSELEPVAGSEPTAALHDTSAEPATAPDPMPPSQDPAIASTVSIPAEETSEGGEWDLLTGKLRDWMANNELNEIWEKTQTPAKLVGLLILVIVVLQIYSGILNTIEKLPLAPGLLELAGVIWLARFALQNLVRSGDRKQALDGLRNLWGKVTGR